MSTHLGKLTFSILLTSMLTFMKIINSMSHYRLDSCDLIYNVFECGLKSNKFHTLKVVTVVEVRRKEN